MIDYFTQLFSTIDTEWESVTNFMTNNVTSDQNAILLVEVGEKKI